MSVEDQIAYEARARNRQAAVAVAAGLLLLLGTLVAVTGYHTPVSEQTLNLIADHRRGARNIIAAVINAAGQLGVVATIIYLYRCARARKPEVPVAIPILALVGLVVAVLSGIFYAIEITHTANEFVTTGAQTYDEANRLSGGAKLIVPQVGEQVGALLVAFALVLTSLQALRVGLLPRVVGYVGVLAAFLIVVPIVAIPIVQLYWLLAVAYLISGRWPSGLPPAWRTGQAEPWPPAAELRARRAAEVQAARGQRAQRRGGGRPAPASATLDSDTSNEDDAPSGRASAGPTKRKRKRRR